MHARIAFLAAIVATTLCVTAANAADGTVIVPAAWAGIWDVTEQTTTSPTSPTPPPACGSGSVTTRSYRDTLCAGDTMRVFSYPPGVSYFSACSGPGFTDTALQLHCEHYAFGPSCAPYAYIDWDAVWSRSGDVATTSATYTFSSSASYGCVSRYDCTQTTSTRTRVSDRCDFVVPVRWASWGSLKLLYR